MREILETDPARSALMKRVRQSNTSAEQEVASALHNLGIGYRRNVKSLPGCPDFANKSRGWAIFVNGCFWHHHRCSRGTIPKRNRQYWLTKFCSNRTRDARKVHQLRRAGFRVAIVWECQSDNRQELFTRLLQVTEAR